MNIPTIDSDVSISQFQHWDQFWECSKKFIGQFVNRTHGEFRSLDATSMLEIEAKRVAPFQAS